MNIQTAELPKEAMAQTVDAERAVKAAPPRDDQPRVVPETQERPSSGQEQKGLDREKAGKILGQAQEYFKDKGVDLNFKLVDGDGTFQVEVVDAQSRKVIRKIPEDEIVELADNLKRMAKGVLDKAV